ncbi:MAG: FtsX-like permease family protein [Thermoanaerobaculia bacterium]|nr:MAG: FtsX-like permease family protein [Thermoanaerobaculia bacterium]
MNALGLAARFLRWRLVASSLTVLSVALALGVVIALRSVPAAIGAGTVEPAVRFPVVVGRGEAASRLVLGVVFLEPPAPPPIPRSVLVAVRAVPGVGEAFPISVRHAGGPLVSTTRSYFHQGAGRLELARGRFFVDAEQGTGVVGNRVARERSLELGDMMRLGDSTLRVVGILAATGTSIDAAVFEPLRPTDRAISAVVVVPGPGFDPQALARSIDQRDLLVVPVASTVRRLVGLVAGVERIVEWISWAVAALTLALVLSSFHASFRERLRDLAVLRVLGARRGTVMLVLGSEAAILGVLGSLLGLVAGATLLAAARSALSTGGFLFDPHAGGNVLGVVLIAGGGAFLAGLAAAATAYRLDPVGALAGVHRPWPELSRVRARLRAVLLAGSALFLAVVPSSTHFASTAIRSPSSASLHVFGMLQRWDGNGRPPQEIAELVGRQLEVEGYLYEPPPYQRFGGWRSGFFLIPVEPPRPVELFHDSSEHEPAVNERIWVDLQDPVEGTPQLMRVTGRLMVGSSTTEWGEAVYRLVGARARVLALEGD